MPRPAAGELRRLANGFAARITIRGRERRDFPLTAGLSAVEAEERKSRWPGWRRGCARQGTRTRSRS